MTDPPREPPPPVAMASAPPTDPFRRPPTPGTPASAHPTDPMKPSLWSILIALALSHLAAVILVQTLTDGWPRAPADIPLRDSLDPGP